MLKFPYQLALYRKNNYGEPCVWIAMPFDDVSVEVYYGILGKKIKHEITPVNRIPKEECKSRAKAKQKQGYKYLSEIRDAQALPVEGELINWLTTYLPDNRTTVDGRLLAMLAKVFDNTNNKVFKRCSTYIGQWKINGLRCFIKVEKNEEDLFKPYKLVFQSREGTLWNSLSNLEEYLLEKIDDKVLDRMYEEHLVLDGELYAPGYSVNEINHFVKDPNSRGNKILQFWCYDIAVEDIIQYSRINLLTDLFEEFISDADSKISHLGTCSRFVILPIYDVGNEDQAIMYRDKFIKMGFEGLIMRDPSAEYQFGKRNSSMIKFKRSTDGVFEIIDIYPEGTARKDVPLFLCKNDINDSVFEVHINGTLADQSKYLINKDKYIGRKLFITFGERSGVNYLPFHVKEVRLYEK